MELTALSYTTSSNFTISCHFITLMRDKPDCQLKSLDLGPSPNKGQRPIPNHSSFRNTAAGVTVFQRCMLVRISVSPRLTACRYILHYIGQTPQHSSTLLISTMGLMKKTVGFVFYGFCDTYPSKFYLVKSSCHPT